MTHVFAALLVLAAAPEISASGGQQRPSSLTPEQQAEVAKMPAVGEEKRVKADGIDSVMSNGDVVLLDVREAKEIEELGAFAGSINIPLPQLQKRLAELPRDKTILTA